MENDGLGNTPIRIRGIAFFVVYFIILAFLLFYHLAKLWPHPTPGQTTAPTSTVTAPANGSAAAAPAHPEPLGPPRPDAQPAAPQDGKNGQGKKPGVEVTEQYRYVDANEVVFFWGTCTVYNEMRLLLIVLLCGAVGGTLHCIRSFNWYAGNRLLKWSWSVQYFLLPLSGAMVALIFYLVVRGGFFAPTSKLDDTSPFGFAALAALVGMFSPQAVKKLKEVAETMLTKPDEGKDAAPRAFPKISGMTPVSGPTAGGTSVTLTGSGFATGVSVQFGGIAATSVQVNSATEIRCVTPAHAAGRVDVTLHGAEHQPEKSPIPFTYTDATLSVKAGPRAGGTVVTIQQIVEKDVKEVQFGGKPATLINNRNGDRLDATTPAATNAGKVDVVLVMADGSAITLDKAFEYQ